MEFGDLFELNHDDGVSTATLSIHKSCSFGSMTFSDCHYFGYIFIVSARMLAEAINKYAECLALSDLESLLWSVFDFDHEILDFLVVDFAHACNNLVRNFWIVILGYLVEDFFTSQRNDASILTIADHGVTLATSRLAIGKQASMETLPSIIEHAESNLLEHVLLVLVFGSWFGLSVSIFQGVVPVVTPEREVKRVLLFFLGVKNIGDYSLSVSHIDTQLVFAINFRQKWSDSNPNLYSAHINESNYYKNLADLTIKLLHIF